MQSTQTTAIDAALSHAIVEQAPDAIIFADTEGVIRLWNGGAERIFGHLAADVIGSGLEIIIPEKLVQAHHNGFNHAMATGTMKYVNKVLTTRSMHKDGSTLYVDLSFGMVHDPAGKVLGALAVARDCTERYNAERAQRVKIAELEKAVADKAASAE
jgi:PAS domain S-box-containing protein